MRRSMRIASGVLFILLLFVKCTPLDYEGELPNGYKLFKANSTEIGISRGLILFTGDINEMNVKGDLVFGKVDELPPEIQKNRIRKIEAPPGYFILNTRTGSLQLGLDEQKWLSELRKTGVLEKPALMMPTAFAEEPLLITTLKFILALLIVGFMFYSR